MTLDRFPFADALTASDRADLERLLRPARLRPGDPICLEGDHCQALPFVVRGEARVLRTSPAGRVLTLYTIAPGESCILTASCLLSGRPFPAYAEAETDVEAALLPADAFVEAFGRLPPLREHVFGLLAARFADVIELVDAVAFQRLDARLAAHLLDQADGGGRIPRTHEALAEALGTSREVVSRTLKEFERRGHVALGRGEVVVRDAPALRAHGAL